MSEDFGIKIAKPSTQAVSKIPTDLSFDSALATYLMVITKVVTVSTDPYSFPYGIPYLTKVIIFHITTTYSRKLPYDDGNNKRDFSILPGEVKIRGATNGDTFKIYIFAQPIL